MKFKIIFITVIFILVFSGFMLYSRYISTNGLVTKEYKIVSKKLDKKYHGLKIVHISDLHYGSTIFEKELDKIVSEINLINPDIVVFTGDLFKTGDISSLNLSDISNRLKTINTKIGKYSVMGNHDYENLNSYKKVIKDSNFTDLNDSYELVYKDSNKPILIAGLSTNLFGTLSLKDKTNPIIEFIEETDTTYNILLMHEPDFLTDFDYGIFDLVLAGHSHNGQVRLPIIGALYTPFGSKKYYTEYYKLNNTDLYISSGLGTSLLNLRFFNKPSFNYYRLTNY